MTLLSFFGDLLVSYRYVLLLCLILPLLWYWARHDRHQLPPGVKRLPRLPGLPYFGRFWDVPTPAIEAAWHFGALHKKYGPIYEWKAMGVTRIWVETEEIARELFVRRQKNYCDRNEQPAAPNIKHDCEILPLSGYSKDFVRHKNFIHAIMRDAIPNDFYGWPKEENKKTLRRLLDSPDRWSEHLMVHCARTVAGIAWGDPVHGKKLLKVVPDLLKVVSPEGPIINKLPFLKHLPALISPFKNAETKRKQLMQDAFREALNGAKNRKQEPTPMKCWSDLWLRNEKAVGATQLDHDEAAYAIGSSSFVAIITIGGPMHAFFLAVCHYPDWLSKLQEEVDRICGDRVPEMTDMPHMPRLRATVKELLRWRQSTPLGVPREVMADDIYEDYFIPKGAIVFANFYLISREESKYPRPEEFLPKRWLDPAYPTYREPLTEFPNIRGDLAFGYGNRACPGADLTNMELCTLLGSIVWAFDIAPKYGREQQLPWYEVNPFAITMTKHFPVRITARNETRHQAVINGCDDPGYFLGTGNDRWHVPLEDGDRLWSWEGLTPEYISPQARRVYPDGV